MQISISNIVKGTVIGSAFTAISRYFTRVTQAGAIYEKPLCVESGINSSPLLQQASMLILPSGYKGGTAYAELPSNGNGDLTWTRGSDAFRTNASGLLQRVPWNLLQYSEDFSNIYWSKDAGVTVDTNVDLAPNGTTTADRLNLSTNGAVYRSGLSFGTGSFTLSVWLKGEGANIGKQVLLEFTNGNSTVTLTGDWQRFTTTGTNVINVAIKRATSGQATAVLAWGIQVVEGTTAQTYLPTTDRLNFPRLSYMYGSCPSALLEPQRTNLFLQSGTFDNASWTKVNATVTANTTTSPDGNINADTLTSTATSGVIILQTSTIVSGTTYSTTFYAKQNTQRFIFIRFTSNASNQNYVSAVFDLQDGTLGDTSVGTTSGTLVSATATSSANGFYRITVIASISRTDGNVGIGFATAKTGNTFNVFGTIASAITSGNSFYIYGAQLEAGAYPTTYIPTTSATATRVADSFSRSNIYTNGLISASGGTWFVELKNNIPYLRDNGNALFIGDTTFGATNAFNISVVSGTQRLVIYKRVAGAFTSLRTTASDNVKIAIKWNGSTADVFENGVKVVSATAFPATLMEFLYGQQGVPVFIQAMALFPTPLSDTDCQTITTL